MDKKGFTDSDSDGDCDGEIYLSTWIFRMHRILINPVNPIKSRVICGPSSFSFVELRRDMKRKGYIRVGFDSNGYVKKYIYSTGENPDLKK